MSVTVNSSAVQAAMLDIGVGVYELAERAKIPTNTVSVLHRKDTRVRIPTLSRLARALQVEPQSLIKGTSKTVEERT